MLSDQLNQANLHVLIMHSIVLLLFAKAAI